MERFKARQRGLALVAAGRLLLKPRPWTGYLHCIFVVYLGQVMIHNVIDNDHWRHLFLLYGLLWGIIAADKLWKRDARQALASQPTAEATPRAAYAAVAPVAVARTAIERAPILRPATVPRWQPRTSA